MFSYCKNDPDNKVDYDGREGIVITTFTAFLLVAFCGLVVYFMACGSTYRNAWYYAYYSIYDYINYWYQQYVYAKNKQNKQAEQSSKGGSTPANPTPPDPNRPQNDRKFNVSKSESPQWRSFRTVKNSSLRTSGSGVNQRYYKWDFTHNDIEVFNYRGEHLGSMDPVTGEIYKPAVAGRTIPIP